MILDIDIGNTRLKWRLSHNLEIISAGNESGYLQEMLVNLLLKIKDKNVKRIRLAHVLRIDCEKEITAFFYKKINVVVEYARAKDRCGVVINQYYQPEQLGVDRWLAVLAAFDHARKACCVIDCGSAITVDFILDDGAYIGGYITSGLTLLAKSLSENTKLLPEIETYKHAKLLYGKSTIEAIQSGTLLMVVSFIERSIKNVGKSENKITPLYLTGGDAEVLAKHLVLLDAQIILMPNLVLDGLSVALP